MQEGRAQAEKERGAEVGRVEAGGLADGNGVMERRGRAGSARQCRRGPAGGRQSGQALWGPGGD